MEKVVVSGIVKHYNGNGRKLGYPTANIGAKITLRDGVYFGFADLGQYKHHPALIFIGEPITIGDPIRRTEAYLLDITDEDFYGKKLNLEICEFHRPNELFTSVEVLIKTIKNDENTARKWFGLNKSSVRHPEPVSGPSELQT